MVRSVIKIVVFADALLYDEYVNNVGQSNENKILRNSEFFQFTQMLYMIRYDMNDTILTMYCMLCS